MLCSPRGMHPMDCRIACDLSAVRYHGIYRKLSGDMLGACASAMMVSDCPHGQDKRIIQRKVSPKMPPHGAFQPNPHRRSTCQQKPFSGFALAADQRINYRGETESRRRRRGGAALPRKECVPAALYRRARRGPGDGWKPGPSLTNRPGQPGRKQI